MALVPSTRNNCSTLCNMELQEQQHQAARTARQAGKLIGSAVPQHLVQIRQQGSTPKAMHHSCGDHFRMNTLQDTVSD